MTRVIRRLIDAVVRRFMIRVVNVADMYLYYTGQFLRRAPLEVWAYDHGWVTLWPGRVKMIELARKMYCNGRHYV